MNGCDEFLLSYSTLREPLFVQPMLRSVQNPLFYPSRMLRTVMSNASSESICISIWRGSPSFKFLVFLSVSSAESVGANLLKTDFASANQGVFERTRIG